MPTITARDGGTDNDDRRAGRGDPEVLIRDAEVLPRQLPNSALAVLDCGHAAWEEAAADYGRIASAWIASGFRQGNR
ncbi:MAG TPA: hypothetical protein VGD56_00580 [Gemmatirosa sp.]